MQIPNTGPRRPIGRVSGASVGFACPACGHRLIPDALYDVVAIQDVSGRPARAIVCTGCQQLLQIS